MINFYGKFVLNMSTELKPLYDLLQKGTKWRWSRAEDNAFNRSKAWLTHENVLTFYDPKKELGLVCDASAYGVGAVLFHRVGNDEKPIAYASRTLSKAEKGYAQIEKEALAVVFGLKKFHKYLYGRNFSIYSDHQPLAGLLGHEKQIPAMSAARMQRWALLLAAYSYKWVYRKGSQIQNADALSRLPLPNVNDSSDYVSFFSAVDEVPLSAREIRRETEKDSVMKRVLFFTLNGWPSHVDNEALQPYFVRRHELSVDQGCVTWGNRVIIPEVFREKVLSLLHEGHPGTTRMKMLSRSHVWWPLITYDVENTVKNCSTCQLTQNAPPRVPLLTWGWPTRRWQRVHLDFAYRDQNWFLIVVDAHSKWVEVFLMSSTTTKCTIERLRSVFAAFGLPEEVVTDNGPQFVATEFVEFLSMNGVRHTKSPPYHPASNGSAERCVQTVKRDLLRQVIDEQRTGVPKSMQHRVDQFLFAYRNTPTGTTDRTPAELFLSWKPRTRLSFLHPEMERRMRDRQQQIKTAADMRRGSWRTFEEGDQVLVRGSRPTDPAWLVGRVMKKVSASTYVVIVQDQHRYVHVDDVRPRHFEHSSAQRRNVDTPAATPRRASGGSRDNMTEPAALDMEPVSETAVPTTPVLRSSIRQRRPPERYSCVSQPKH
ncbi:uncharacterized protein K02A2.6-like [Ixodes scapularis]|uniref:uncharacterized protein K02A2.6-like n=1 Tax=Ixodes scapularis TaxID=6945 RepID=UPI001C392D46|nr:uncharacterized protein K02A2.6-like [Ixodes scapularis]